MDGRRRPSRGTNTSGWGVSGDMSGFEIGRGSLESFEQAVRREWLLTNGLGGFASGTVGEANTRRYHGLLVAALRPPLGRTLTVAKLDVTVRCRDDTVALTSNEFADGAIDPHGYRHIESFRLEQGLPVWRFAFDDVLIEKRVLMPYGENTTLLQYRVRRASSPLQLTLRPLCTYRDYHAHTHGGWDMRWESLEDGFRISAYDGAQPYVVRIVGGAAEVVADPAWYWRFRHRLESRRGLDDTEDLFSPGTLRSERTVGEAVTVAISSKVSPSTGFDRAWAGEVDRRRALVAGSALAPEPEWVRQLVLAADQFIVARKSVAAPGGRTVIAGYHWFGDWGRDTMIALPGLTLACGRFEDARDILHTFAGLVDRGMLPNRFPDDGAEPEYNTVDATLWFIQAVHAYTLRSRDPTLASALLDTLIDIVEWHRRGTRYGIRVDGDDGLLAAGEAGVQLTWMDAKVGERVITPRIGKCVEVNALWYNALCCISELAERAGKAGPARDFERQAAVVERGFGRFWNKDAGYLHDVIDGPEGTVQEDGRRVDTSLRPNQLFAVSLPHSALARERQRTVVDVCARRLLTSHGLRSLAAGDPRYVARYGGDPTERDAAYHQGTVWGWLLGPFAEAHFRVYRDVEQARSFLRPLALHLLDAGVGSISEIFDAEAPHAARGCIAQAWSVAETLRVWRSLAAETAERGGFE